MMGSVRVVGEWERTAYQRDSERLDIQARLATTGGYTNRKVE